MLLPAQSHSRECAKRDEKPRKLVCYAKAKKSTATGNAKENSPKLTERSLNVYENKGPLWKTSERSLNLYENKVA
jgi:hypothetical protein